jgi:UDP-N-acetylglucosamine 2-epimerase (non-hydrolysing)
MSTGAKSSIFLAVGTRPEAIKMAPLYFTLKAGLPGTDVKICATAQHRQMLDQVFDLFGISPDFDLNLMKPGQSLEDLSAALLTNMRDVLVQHRPNLLLVHGDTTTCMMSALAGFYAGVEIGHVEAGLRTLDLKSPFPEEMNRQVVARLADLHFAPTAKAKSNLLAENVPEGRIHVTGNTVIDALHWVLKRSQQDKALYTKISKKLSEQLPFEWRNSDIVLVTGHRRENFGRGMQQVCQALQTLAKAHPSVHFVYPVHRNPNVFGPVGEYLGGIPNIHLLEPLDYLQFVNLLASSTLVLTDSGGIQEEAPSLGKPVLVMRDVTERPEAVAAGTVRLVGTDPDAIVAQTTALLAKGDLYKAMSTALNPYGDGQACARIVNVLKARGWQ